MHMYTCTQYVHFTTKINENPLSDFGEVAMIICSSSILLIVDKLLSSERGITP